MTPILKDIATSGKVYACLLCFNKGDLPLDKCLVGINKRGGSSNATLHVQKHHEEEFKAMEMAKKKSIAALDSNTSNERVTSSVLGKRPASQGLIDSFARPLKKPEIVDRFVTHVVHFFNDSGIAARHAQSTEFNDLISFVVDNTKHLKNADDRKVGRVRYRNELLSDIANMHDAVRESLDKCRSRYQEATGSSQPFLSVSHDIWDGLSKEKLGISINWVDIATWEHHTVSVATLHIESHTAQRVSECVLETLVDRVGVKKSDIFCSVNDTTNSAVAAGRKIVADSEKKEDATCRMHIIDLVMEHALGLATRSRSGVVVDSFVACCSLIKKAKNFLHWLSGKKNKQRFARFVTLVKSNLSSGIDPCKPATPGDTRVSSTYLMFDALMCSYHEIRLFLFMSNHPKDKNCPFRLTEQEWVDIAQITALLSPISKYSFAVQVDHLGAIGGSWLHCMAVKEQLLRKREIRVINFTKPSWISASSAYKKLPKVPLPCEDLGMMAMTFRDRLVQELDNYMQSPSKDQLVAMACHPLIATIGNTFMKRLNAARGKEISAQSQRALVDEVVKMLPPMEPVNLSDDSSLQNEECANAHADVADEMSDFLKTWVRDTPGGGDDFGSGEPGRPSNTQLAEKEVEDFFAQRIDWKTVVSDTHRRPGSSDGKIDWTDGEVVNVLNIEPVFDVGKWWLTVGARQFPTICLVAARILAKPDTNAYQERVFSRCTFVDQPLRQRMNPETFELRVLSKVNRNWIKANADRRSKMTAASALSKAAKFLYHGASANGVPNTVISQEERLLDALDEDLEASEVSGDMDDTEACE